MFYTGLYSLVASWGANVRRLVMNIWGVEKEGGCCKLPTGFSYVGPQPGLSREVLKNFIGKYQHFSIF